MTKERLAFIESLVGSCSNYGNLIIRFDPVVLMKELLAEVHHLRSDLSKILDIQIYGPDGMTPPMTYARKVDAIALRALGEKR